jgi:hypothetical protein
MEMQLVVRRDSSKKALAHKKNPEFEALTTMCERDVFWDVMYSLVDGYEHFRGTWTLKTKEKLRLKTLVPV